MNELIVNELYGTDYGVTYKMSLGRSGNEIIRKRYFKTPKDRDKFIANIKKDRNFVSIEDQSDPNELRRSS